MERGLNGRLKINVSQLQEIVFLNCLAGRIICCLGPEVPQPCSKGWNASFYKTACKFLMKLPKALVVAIVSRLKFLLLVRILERKMSDYITVAHVQRCT